MRAVCASLLLDTRPVTFRAVQGWLSTLPSASTRCGSGGPSTRLRRRVPVRERRARIERRIFLGRNATTGGLVFVDRFALENHNQVILARSGAGKSYLAKLQILRSLYEGVEVLVIDPEDEYRRPAEAVGGVVVKLGSAGERLNPLDLPRRASQRH